MTLINEPIGEIVEIIDPVKLIAEVYNNNFSLINGNIFFSEKNTIKTLFLSQNIFKEPIDKSRRAVALNLTYEEIISKYPQNKFIIKDYMSLFLMGTIQDYKFIGLSQIVNVGIHERIYELTKPEYKIFIDNEEYLYSVLIGIYNNKQIVLSMKPFLKILLKYEKTSIFLSNLYKILTIIFKNDYLLLKDIVSDLKLD